MKMFNPSLMELIKKPGTISGFAAPSYSVWTATQKMISFSLRPVQLRNICIEAGINIDELIEHWRECLSKEYPTFSEEGIENATVYVFKEARRVRLRVQNNEISSWLGNHEIIEYGCAVQVRICQGQGQGSALFLESDPSSSAKIRIYAVIGVVKIIDDGDEKSPWALCFRCMVLPGKKIKLSEPMSKEKMRWLELCDGIRRIGIYHYCQAEVPVNCTVNAKERTVSHSGSLLKGAVMRYQTSSGCFPPRMG